MLREANLLSTHFLFKIKKYEEGNRKLKDMIFFYGNRDEEKEEVPKDGIATYMMTTRLIMALGMMIKFIFGVADIKGSYMQSAPTQSYILIETPPEFKKNTASTVNCSHYLTMCATLDGNGSKLRTHG